jgi:hypothetical protein
VPLAAGLPATATNGAAIPRTATNSVPLAAGLHATATNGAAMPRTAMGSVPVAGGNPATNGAAPPRTATGSVPLAAGLPATATNGAALPRTATSSVPLAAGLPATATNGAAIPRTATPAALPRTATPAPVPQPRAVTQARPLAPRPAPRAVPPRPAARQRAAPIAIPRVDRAFAERAKVRLAGVAEKPQPPYRRPTPQELEAVVKTWTGEIPRPEAVMTGSRMTPLNTVMVCRRNERSALALKAVLQQFAPAVNPRYAKGERGQLFVWDVATAMECTVPRFSKYGERTLHQVASWFRTASLSEGWIRVSTERAQALADQGFLVVALPKTRAWEALAIVQPGPGLKVASACQRQRGMHLEVRDALGVGIADFFFHE